MNDPTPQPPVASSGAERPVAFAERILPGSQAEIPDDFARLDFGRLWRGRDRTIEVERALTRQGLGCLPADRIVELGTGDGRLTPVVAAATRQYVGVDQQFEFLERVRDRLPSGTRAVLVEANVLHLPFTGGSMTSALLARVFNFLTKPVAALEEIRRVLVPGGGVVFTCNVRPSSTSAIEDLRLALEDPPGTFQGTLTFDRSAQVRVRRSPFHNVEPTRRWLRGAVAAAGLDLEQTFGSGLEDYRLTRTFPSRLWTAAGIGLGRAPVFPMAWVVGRAPARPSAASLRPMNESIACPRCGRPFGVLDLDHDFERACGQCGFVVRRESGIVRARYVESA